MAARAWGVENLPQSERARLVLEAGVDQFGGEACPDVIVELVRRQKTDVPYDSETPLFPFGYGLRYS